MGWLAVLKGLPWRQIAQFVAVLIVVALLYLTVRRAWWDLPEARRATETAQAALKVEVDCGAGSKCAERVAALQARQAEVSKQVVSDYEQELADIRNQPVRTDPVRLCRPARSSDVRGGPVTAGTHSDAASGVLDRQDGGDHSEGAGPDIGPDLRQYARDVETLSGSKRAIVRIDEARATVPK